MLEMHRPPVNITFGCSHLKFGFGISKKLLAVTWPSIPTVEKARLGEGLEGLRENLCRLYGTRSFALTPGLTSWANLFRPSGAGSGKILFHRLHPTSSFHIHAPTPCCFLD